MIETQLIDARNFDAFRPVIASALKESKLVGIDLETHDDDRHDGLNKLCGYDPVTRKKSKGKKLVFDFNRTTICGLSLYSDAMSAAFYLNLNHADVENRIPWPKVKALLDEKPSTSPWIAHNAAFEIAGLRSCYDYPVDDNIICTMQMAVSAHGPHEYAPEAFVGIGQGGMQALIPDIIKASIDGVKDPKEMTMTPALNELVYKIIAKESDAAHSYNGLVSSIAYGYGLKQLVQRIFGHQMTTFDECLKGRAHMGQLTGAETAEYGAEDAYWAVRLYGYLVHYMLENGGEELLATFFSQENPMPAIFADVRRKGLSVNLDKIEERRNDEREHTAEVLREIKEGIRDLLPFSAEPFEPLTQDSWYSKGHAKYRKNITDWANIPDQDNSYDEVRLVSGAVSNSWGVDEGDNAKSAGPNLSHYMPVRTILYDLFQQEPIKEQGKIQSDGEARAKIRERLLTLPESPRREASLKVIEGMAKLASIEQRMKLYLTPYMLLTDPETKRLYPELSSLLATRRTSCSNPNGQQLVKRGEAVYIRDFFEADHDDHFIVGADWSAVELVAIGEQSRDPEFIKAFGQRPHQDLHAGAAAAILAVEVPDLTETSFRALKGISAEDAKHLPARLVTDLKGQPIAHDKIFGYWRTSVGKVANFSYWFSGWLYDIGISMGWDQEKTARAVENYTSRFQTAVDWRSNVISQVQRDGYVTLPDHHRYVRYEATPEWYQQWMAKFPIAPAHAQLLANYRHVVEYMGKKIQKRAFNQTVNALIQGSCAGLAKRSIIRMRDKIKAKGWTDREVRFMLLVHDEMIYSVHKDIVVEFVPILLEAMCDHPELFKYCKLDAAPSIGYSFAPWTEEKYRLGQVELFELPKLILPEQKDRYANDNVELAMDWLQNERRKLAA